MIKTFILLFLPLMLAAQIPQGYYDEAQGKSGQDLKHALHTIINQHKVFSYSSLWNILRYTDEDTANSNNVILLYSGRSQSKFLNGGDPDEWNREHVWAKSHGFPDESDTAYTDAHHIRPTDVSVNGSRGNLDFDNGGSAHPEAPECFFDNDSWEPRDVVKGDVARMMFYMAVRYEQDGEYDLELVEGIPSSGPTFAKLTTLLQWHESDPVDDFERRRNDRIYSYQNNRNPFIDHPEYVDLIWKEEIKPEPERHARNLAAVASGTTITLNWDDAIGQVLPEYYLIVAGDAGFAALATPEDGTPYDDDTNLADGSAIVTVPFRTTSYVFEGLLPAQAYYFKVYTYSNSGANSDYKTDGEIPQASAVSGGAGSASEVIISEYVEGSSFNKYLELYNGTETEIDLSGYSVQVYYNGSNGAGTDISLSGSLSANTAFVLAHSSADAWNGQADLTDENLAFNGNDVVVLRHNGVLIDIIGEIGDDSELFKDKTLQRKASVTEPANSFDSQQWNEPGLTYDGLGSHTITSALPAEVTFFSAIVLPEANVELNWQTSAESDIRGFVLKRSGDDGAVFETLEGADSLTARGGPQSGADYTYTDASAEAGKYYLYRLYAEDNVGFETLLAETSADLTTAISERPSLPRQSALYGAYPNPFNPSATILFYLQQAGSIQLKIYDSKGSLVCSLFRGRLAGGTHHIRWDGKNTSSSDVASGVYIAVLSTPSGIYSSKLLLLR